VKTALLLEPTPAMRLRPQDAPAIRLLPRTGVAVQSRSRPEYDHLIVLLANGTATCTCEDWEFRCRSSGDLCWHQEQTRRWAAAQLQKGVTP